MEDQEFPEDTPEAKEEFPTNTSEALDYGKSIGYNFIEKYRIWMLIALFMIVIFGFAYFVYNLEYMKMYPDQFCRQLGFIKLAF